MKRLRVIIAVVLAFFFLTPAVVSAQTQSMTKKEKRKIEKMQRQKEKTKKQEAAHAYYLALINHKHFVFQADYLTDTQGNSFILDQTINFMAVEGDSAVLQFGFDNLVGWNGVGGLTLRGILYNYKVQQGKKGNGINVHTDVRVIGPGLPPHINLYVSDDGSAQLTINTGVGDQITLFGTIVSPEDANIFRGVPLF